MIIFMPIVWISTPFAVVENYEPNTNYDSTASVTLTNYTGAEMSFSVERSSPGFLVISEIFYADGWIALLNGEEIPFIKQIIF